MHVVLVVEDDPDIRATLCEALEDNGYSAVAASNGVEALEYLRGGNVTPCLILLDLMMPVMDGQAFRQEQRNDATLASIPVVVVSAYRDLDKYAEQLATECLPKPVRLDTLLQTARKHCDSAA
ncbi:MAG: response regulator [Deltaproteobacteria bacterium]|nr:response regulator [Deltaproteobacteria bacterium]